jgi:hypothetical protein
MNLEMLAKELETMLKALRVPYKKTVVIKNVSQQFICDVFGLIVSATTDADIDYVHDALIGKIPNYRYYFITSLTNIQKARQDLIWALAEGGYLYFIRSNFPRQFNELVTMQDFGNKIITERLYRWKNLPKYRYLIEENERARRLSATMVMSTEPSFFDYMPEKQGGVYYVL